MALSLRSNITARCGHYQERGKIKLQTHTTDCPTLVKVILSIMTIRDAIFANFEKQ